jgi:hypothetical protein
MSESQPMRAAAQRRAVRRCQSPRRADRTSAAHADSAISISSDAHGTDDVMSAPASSLVVPVHRHHDEAGRGVGGAIVRLNAGIGRAIRRDRIMIPVPLLR